MRDASWPTTADLLSRLNAAGIEDVVESTLASWRRAKLLDVVEQVSDPRRGSTVFHPPDTFDRIIAIRNLQKEKDDLAWIGAQLWWRYRFKVDETLWRPQLQKTAEKFDPVLQKLRKIIQRDRVSDDLNRTMLPDRLVKNFQPDIIASRVVKRVPLDLLSPVFRLLTDAAAGVEPEWETAPDQGSLPDDQVRLTRAMDLRRSEIDQLGGQRFRFASAMPAHLNGMARAFRAGSLNSAASATAEELEDARDDLRRAAEIAVALYRSSNWIYGPEAFGLRLACWIVTKDSPEKVRFFLLGWVLLRRHGAGLHSSEEIGQIHRGALELAAAFDELQRLYKSDARFKEILEPRRLKRALAAPFPFENLKVELESLGWCPAH